MYLGQNRRIRYLPGEIDFEVSEGVVIRPEYIEFLRCVTFEAAINEGREEKQLYYLAIFLN